MRCHFQHQLCIIASIDIEKSNHFYQAPGNPRLGFRKCTGSTWTITDMINVNGNAIGRTLFYSIKRRVFSGISTDS